MAKYVCTVCGFIYDEDVGIPASDIAAHTKWEDLDENWVCPICKAPKSAFKELKETVKKEIAHETYRNKDIISPPQHIFPYMHKLLMGESQS